MRKHLSAMLYVRSCMSCRYSKLVAYQVLDISAVINPSMFMVTLFNLPQISVLKFSDFIKYGVSSKLIFSKISYRLTLVCDRNRVVRWGQ
jgi:hypothetical protein